MEAALITGRHELAITEMPEPEPGITGVVVDVDLCGICGSDLHAYRSGASYSPALCGHEWTGVLSAVGDGVGALPGAASELTEGDRVVVAVPPACGACAACLAGQAARCELVYLTAIGREPNAPAHGGFAPRLAVDAGRVVKAHPDLSITEAAQVEPATVAFHAVRRTQPRLGDLAVVQGAGPIGLTTVQWVAAAGAGEIVVIEPNDTRRAGAARLGATVTTTPDEAAALILDLSGGLGADVVYECVGRAQAIQSAVALARRGGVVSMIGVPFETASIQPGMWLVKEITMQASLAYTHEDFEPAMKMIAAGKVDLEAIHTKTVDLDGLGAAFEDLATGATDDLKILVDPNQR
ncbi:MAG: zinc-binding dehydrogenase [Actinomycetota bacterium]